MFCSGCGQLLDPNQAVCAGCGKPVTAMPAARPAAGLPGLLPTQSVRVRQNVQTLGVLWIVYACWHVLQVVLAATVLTGMSGLLGNRFGMDPFVFWQRFPFYNAPWLVPLITSLMIGRAILSAAAGLALFRRARWGRTLALVVAFLTLIKPVLGTILAIYTLWVLLPGYSRQEYEAISQA